MPPAELRLQPVPRPVEPRRPCTITAQVTNTTGRVERFFFSATGPLAPWCQVEPGHLDLYRDGVGIVQVTLTVPPGPQPAAGEFWVGLRARIGDGPVATAQERLVVAPHPALSDLHLDQHPTHTLREAAARVSVTNTGNVPLHLSVRAQDEDGELEFDPPERPLSLPLGTTAACPLAVRCRRLYWWGPTLHHRYAVTATDGGLSASAAGVLHQRAVLNPWRLLLIPVAIVLVLAALVLGAVAVVTRDAAPVPWAVLLVAAAVALLGLMSRLR